MRGLDKLKSRKLWATVAGVALSALAQQLGMDPEQAENVVALIVAYIVGQSAVDIARPHQEGP